MTCFVCSGMLKLVPSVHLWLCKHDIIKKYRSAATAISNMHKNWQHSKARIEHVFPDICSWTDRHADTHTDMLITIICPLLEAQYDCRNSFSSLVYPRCCSTDGKRPNRCCHLSDNFSFYWIFPILHSRSEDAPPPQMPSIFHPCLCRISIACSWTCSLFLHHPSCGLLRHYTPWGRNKEPLFFYE